MQSARSASSLARTRGMIVCGGQIRANWFWGRRQQWSNASTRTAGRGAQSVQLRSVPTTASPAPKHAAAPGAQLRVAALPQLQLYLHITAKFMWVPSYASFQ